jgi:hypothetical protein
MERLIVFPEKTTNKHGSLTIRNCHLTILAVLVRSVYQLRITSNYSSGRRPAVVWLDHRQVQVIQAREVVDDFFQRDHRLVKLAGTG